MKYRIEENPVIPAYIEKLNVSPLCKRMMAVGGLNKEQVAELMDSNESLPLSTADCVIAARNRILDAKSRNEKIFIGGDYDADGICSTAIMKGTLDRLGIQNGYYIPNRLKEGYGLSAHIVELAAKKGYSVIMTVDNGVAAHEALIRAHELGMTVIVTDHHQITAPVEADIVVHPDYMEPGFAFYSGAGVALAISQVLVGEVPMFEALAAVAAIGDVMPLWRETRRLVKLGIRMINRGECPAVTAMERTTKYPKTVINEEDIGFEIVPRLNSIGRMGQMGNVNHLVPFMLSARYDNECAVMANQINMVNDARKSVSDAALKRVEKAVKPGEKFILYVDESLSDGICGIVAGKIVQTYGVPALVMTKAQDGVTMKGSARSTGSFNVFEFLKQYSGYSAFGGHAAAAGCSVPVEKFSGFQEFIHQTAKSISLGQEQANAVYVPDNLVTAESIASMDAIRPIPAEMKAPFAVHFRGGTPSLESGKVKRWEVMNEKSGIYSQVLFQKNFHVLKPDAKYALGSLSTNTWHGTTTAQILINEMQ